MMARITPEGLKLLGRLDKPVQDGHRKQLGHLGPGATKDLTELLQAARSRASLIFWSHIRCNEYRYNASNSS